MTKDIIIDNRLVSDETFAIRFRSFIERVEVCDMASEEEREYLIDVATRLLAHQVATVKDKSEILYLKGCGLNVNY